MPRKKKEYTSFSMRADATVMRRFTAYCEEVGQSKTLAFERIITAYIDDYERKKSTPKPLSPEDKAKE